MVSHFDDFYTVDSVASQCVKTVLSYCNSKSLFVEPSAGGGSFVRALEAFDLNYVAFDIRPKFRSIVAVDWFTIDEPFIPGTVVVGNPPFGSKAETAIRFIEHANSLRASLIAFILPIQFRKYGTQKQLPEQLALIHDSDLSNDSCIGTDLRLCFQIWKPRPVSGSDLRIRTKPPTSHNDFDCWQYNNTEQAESVFLNDFDFAVPRQGYQDYSRRETDESNCERSTQWILFKAKSPETLATLRLIDFDRLSRLNTVTPGFGKADVVAEYERLKQQYGRSWFQQVAGQESCGL